MRTSRFFIHDTAEESRRIEAGEDVQLPRDEAKHCTEVLRLSRGAEIELLHLATKRIFRAELLSGAPRKMQAEVRARLLCEIQPQALPAIHLIVGLPKPSIGDFITEKSVELGVHTVCFFGAERSQGRLRANEAESRLARFERIRNAALKQSRSVTFTDVQLADSLYSALARLHPDVQAPKSEIRLLCLEPEARDAKGQVADITDILFSRFGKKLNNYRCLELPTRGVDLYLIVGPEGGIAPSEHELASRYHYLVASLGQNVLRTETAALLACGLAQLLR